MRDWIRARLDAYEGRYEQRDKEFAGLVSHHVNALSNRRTLKTYILILSSVNALIWLSVIALPKDVAAGWPGRSPACPRLRPTEGLFLA